MPPPPSVTGYRAPASTTKRILIGCGWFIGCLALYFLLQEFGAKWGIAALFSTAAFFYALGLYGFFAWVTPKITKDVTEFAWFTIGGVTIFIALITISEKLGITIHPLIAFSLWFCYLVIVFFTELKLRALYIVVNVILFTLLFTFPTIFFMPGTPIYDAVEGQRMIIGGIIGGFKEVKEKVTTGIEREIAIATGDYFTGTVDAQAQKKLGVFLEKVGTVSKSYYVDKPVNVFATLKAEAFETEKPIAIKINCYAGYEDDKVGAEDVKIYPQKEFAVEQYEHQQIDCIFDEDTFENNLGTNTVTIEVEFTFQTDSYIKAYFMARERSRAYRRQGLDPLGEFKITDKRPVAVYTPGPIGIGMDVGEQPLLIDTETPGEKMPGPTLGITFENKWAGKLKSMNNVTIIAPPGLEIKDIGGNEIPEKQCRKELAGEDACYIDKDWITKNVDDFKISENIRTMRIHTRVVTPQEVLSNAPLAIKSFKTSAKYTYQIKQTVDVLIKQRK